MLPCRVIWKMAEPRSHQGFKSGLIGAAVLYALKNWISQASAQDVTGYTKNENRECCEGSAEPTFLSTPATVTSA